MPNASILPLPKVLERLRVWSKDRTRLRLIAKLGVVDLSVFCVVDNVDEDSFNLLVGEDPRDMLGVYLKDWVFALGTRPDGLPESELPVGGVPDMALLAKSPSGQTLMLMALRE